MRRNTSLDPGEEVGMQQLISLFLGHSTRYIRQKLQKLRHLQNRNTEILLDETWRVFSNREEKIRGRVRTVALVIRTDRGSGKSPGEGPCLR